MSPNEFITVATQFLAGDGEGRWRSAVSRAYYGAFHLAREFLSGCGVVLGTDTSAHRNVRWCLANSKDQLLVKAGRLLETLRESRTEADYELSSTRFVLRSRARSEVQLAIEISTLLASYQGDEARNRIAPGIRAYAAKIGLALRAMP